MASAQPLGRNYCGRSAEDRPYDRILDTIRQDGRSERGGAAAMAEIRYENGSGAGAWTRRQAGAGSAWRAVPSFRAQLESAAGASRKGSDGKPRRPSKATLGYAKRSRQNSSTIPPLAV